MVALQKQKVGYRWSLIGFILVCGMVLLGVWLADGVVPSPESPNPKSAPWSVQKSQTPTLEDRSTPGVPRDTIALSEPDSPAVPRQPPPQDTGNPIVYDVEGEGLDAAVRSIRDEAKRCFNRGLNEDDITGGKVVFKFTIEKRVDDPRNADLAMVTEVRVEDTTIDSELVEECVMRKLDGLLFEPPDSPIEIVLPFVLVDFTDD